MATNKDDNVKIDRSYTDNFDIKSYTTNKLIPKYFTGSGISERTVGLLGLTTEQISNISEDVFNTGSVYVREMFPNRAEIPESIYAHAGIFQLSNIFSNAAELKCIIVIDENSIVNNLTYDNGIGYFYIDKNTNITVEGIDFSLDYDIMIKVIKKYINDDDFTYVFSASYMISGEMTNSINPSQNPYIPAKRSTDGFLALEILVHQYTRTIVYETILENSKVNAPVIDIPYEGKLANFDIMYKTSDETDYNTQLEKRVMYSQPLTKPFCYYGKADENVLRITFNSKDLYFSPEFNSSLKITLYITKGEGGNFPVYTGTDVSITQRPEKYSYADQYLMAAKPMTASRHGSNELSMESLQNLTVMGYRTANALTTEPDLREFFGNYSSLYGNNNAVKFIKRRNDVYERLYSAVIAIKDSNKIYKTNTLNLSINMYDMLNPETDLYTIEPGTVFMYKDGAVDNMDCASLYFNSAIREKYQEDYNKAVNELTLKRTSPFYIDPDTGDPIEYSVLTHASLEDVDYYLPYNFTDGSGKYYIRNSNTTDKDGHLYRLYNPDATLEKDDITASQIRDEIHQGKIEDPLAEMLDALYVRTNRTSTYDYLIERIISLSQWVQRKGERNFTYLFDIPDEELAKYDDTRSSLVTVSDRHEWYNALTQRFLFVNPFLIRFLKNPNSVNMYLTFIDQDVIFDFTDQNDDSFIQFISLGMKTVRNFEETKKYTMTVKLEANIPSTESTAPLVVLSKGYRSVDDGSYYMENENGLYDFYDQDGVMNKSLSNVTWSVVESKLRKETGSGTYTGSYIEDDSLLKYKVGDGVDVTQNHLRVVACMRGTDNEAICFVEFKPMAYDEALQIFTFEAEFYTDDHITTTGKLRILTQSKFYDRRISYSYYEQLYPQRVDGSDIYENGGSPLYAKDLINLNTLEENSYVLNTDIYNGYDTIDDFLHDQNDVEDITNVKYKGLREDNGIILPEISVAEESYITVELIRQRVVDTLGARHFYVFVNNDDDYHSFYIIYKLINDDKTTEFKALYVGQGYYASENETCFPVYYQKGENEYYKYPVTSQGFGANISDSSHTDGIYTQEELDDMVNNGLLKKVTVEVNPEINNYYMKDVNKPGVFNYFEKNENGSYYMKRDVNGYPVEYSRESIPSFDIFEEETTVHSMNQEADILVPIEDMNCEIYMLTAWKYTETSKDQNIYEFVDTIDEDGNNIFSQYDKSLTRYIWTNKYSTITDGLTLVKPLTSCKVNVEFEDWRKALPDGSGYEHDMMDIKMYSVPFIKWDIAKDPNSFSYFIRTFSEEYDNLTSIVDTRLRNQSDLDIKLYNTYGLATNFIVGENGESESLLDVLNLYIEFDVWFKGGTDISTVVPEVKLYIKETIEKINTDGLNNLYISNLMRQLESRFSYIDHIRFVRINDYSSDVQTLRNIYVDLDDMTDKTQRRLYIPEILTVDINNIVINDYTV